jgi:hypothetical protein
MADDKKPRGTVNLSSTRVGKLLAKKLEIAKRDITYVFPEVASITGRQPSIEDFWMSGRKLVVWDPLKVVRAQGGDLLCVHCNVKPVSFSSTSDYARRWLDLDKTHFLVTCEYRCRSCPSTSGE